MGRVYLLGTQRIKERGRLLFDDGAAATQKGCTFSTQDHYMEHLDAPFRTKRSSTFRRTRLTGLAQAQSGRDWRNSPLCRVRLLS